MCGILGTSPSVNESYFKSALDQISHRGPDGEGIWSDPTNTVTFGHRRLAILDLSEDGRQPMHFESLTITFNGEIYNYLEIKHKLIGLGHVFHSKSDTEVVLHAYSEWGKGCLNHFNGMWSFAIWNSNDQTIFFSRDRFGKKPLFYSFLGERIVFASEMKAITPFMQEIKIGEQFSWCQSHMYEYEGTEHCLIAGIKRFPAGSWGIWKVGEQKIKINKFWETLDHLVEVPNTYEEQVEEFRRLFLDSCRLRMRSDVPLGTALSGGIDSSATICSMSYIVNELQEKSVNSDWQHAFIANFKGTFLDESTYAQSVVDHLKIPGHFLEIDGVSSISKIEKYLYLFEELYSTSPIPMMDLYQNIKRHGISVTLDGHGADEMLCGYGSDIYRMVRDTGFDRQNLQNIHETFKGVIDIDSSQVQGVSSSAYNIGVIYQHFLGGHKGIAKLFLSKIGAYSYKEYQNKDELGYFNSYLYHIFHRTILPTLLRNYDRYSMAAGVEVRMPFMDHRLVSYAFSLPSTSKNRNGVTKSILRDALDGVIPEKIKTRTSKIGFHTPIVDWMQGPWREYLLDLSSSQTFRNSELINANTVRDQIHNVVNGKNVKFVEGMDAWKSLTPYLWEKSFLQEVKKIKKTIL